MALKFNMGNPNWRALLQAQQLESQQQLGKNIGTSIVEGARGLHETFGPLKKEYKQASKDGTLPEGEDWKTFKDRRKKEKKQERKVKRDWEKTFKKLEKEQKREEKASIKAKKKAERISSRQDKKRAKLKPTTPIAEDNEWTPISKNEAYERNKFMGLGGPPYSPTSDEPVGILDQIRNAVTSEETDAFGNQRILGYSADEAADAIKGIPGVLANAYNTAAPWINRNILGDKFLDDYRYTGLEEQKTPSDVKGLGYLPPAPMKEGNTSQEWDYGTGTSEELPSQLGYSDEYGTYDESGNVIDYYKGTSPTKNVAEPSGFRPWAPGYDASPSGSVMDTPPNPLDTLDIPGITKMMGDFEGFDEGHNRNASIYTPFMAKLGAKKSKKSFVGSDGKTYHYAEFPDADTAFTANQKMVTSMLDSVGGDVERFIMNYIDKPKGHEEVESRLKEMRRRNLLNIAVGNEGVAY